MRPAALRRELEVTAPTRGERAWGLRDPHALVVAGASLAPAALALAQGFDGQTELTQLCDELERDAGVRVPLAVAEGLARELSEAGLLEDEAFAAARATWRALSRREATCAGGAYPSEPAALRRFLKRQLTRARGPGSAPAAHRDAGLAALVSPHIDLHRGGACYAWGWREVAARPMPKTVILLGTSHYGIPEGRFAFTRKAFETPLGALEVDEALLEEVLSAIPGEHDVLAGELAHKGEHSLEFQALQLAWLSDEIGAPPPRLLPILCGSLHDQLCAGQAPTLDPEFASVTRALRRAIDGRAPADVLVVAGVDLAHVGADFGHPALSSTQLAEVNARDAELLDLLASGDDLAFHRHFAADRNARQVCGHAPLSALLALFDGREREGEVLRHDHWTDGASVVGFASAALWSSGA